MAAPSPAAAAGSLRRNGVTFIENIAQTLGSMAPSGGLTLFIPLVFADAGNGTWLLFIPVVAGYALLAANINVFATRTASAGSFADYARQGLGPRAGVVVGWCYFWALAFAVADCVPAIGFYGRQLAGQLGLALSAPGAAGLMVGAVLVAGWAARRGIALSTNLILGVECLSLGTILVLALLFLVHTGRWLDPDQLRLAGATGKGLRLGVILAFMSLAGFESVTTLGEESQQALSAIPRAILCCILPMGLMYLALSYVVVLAFKGSGQDLGQDLVPFSSLAALAGWPRLAIIVGLGVVLSFFACLLGCLNAAARILYALARQGHFFPSFGVAHAANATPDRAIALVAGLAIVLPAAVAAGGAKLEDAMAYGAQLASLGFVANYLWVSVAAPCFLRRRGELRLHHLLVASASAAIFGVALIATVYPVPPPPWGVLPYVFLAAVAAGSGLSLCLGRRSRREAAEVAA